MRTFPLRNLGRSAVQLPIAGVGGAPLGDLHETIPEEQADATLRTAYDSGLRYFDTAPWYGTGKSEHRVGRILRTLPRDSFMISTKAGRCLERPRDLAAYQPSRWVGGLPFEVRFDYTYSGMMRAYEDSLARLGLNRVDLLLIHDIDTNHHATREAVAARFVELVDGGGLRALEELKRSGEIKAFGAGVNLRGTIRDCLDRFDLDFFLVAGPYTLLDQAILDDEWPMLEARGCGVILGSVFASGILAAPDAANALYLTRPVPPHIREKLQGLRAVAARHEVSLAAAAIQFGLANPRVTAIVPGVNHPDQVAMNLELLSTTIPADFWQELKTANLLHPRGTGADGSAMLKVVDCHHHLWDLSANRYPWLTDELVRPIYGSYAGIRRDYKIEEFLAEAKDIELVGTVHVEAGHDADDPVRETRWLSGIAEQPASHGVPHGIVAFADFRSDAVVRHLEEHAAFPRVRGVRQVLNPRKDPWREVEDDPSRDPDWRRRIGLLRRFGFSFDVQIYYQQMASAAALADEHPEVLFILNHTGMPARRDGEGLSGWRSGIRELARRPNFVAKISGFGMVEPTWTVDSIRPFVLDIIDAFGTDRAMFASNYPVDKLMRGYCEIWRAYDAIVGDFSPEERDRLFRANAMTHYRL